MESEHHLLERCRQGDPAAFQELFRHHREDVARLVYRLSVSSHEVEDLVQEVFLQVYRSLKHFHGKSRFSTWLYRVTVNVVLMHRRAARSRPVLVEETAESAASQELPDVAVERARRIAAFHGLLARLSDKKRTVFVLHELEGLSPTEIAGIVQAPVLTVRTRLFYARRELQMLMREVPVLATLVSEIEAGSEHAADEQAAESASPRLGEGGT